METPISDFHVEYPAILRHWSPVSEKYAGADCLVTAVQRGWRVVGEIYREDFWLAGTRLTSVFHVSLERGDESMTMPVISNPYARRLISQNHMTVRPIAERVQSPDRSKV